MSTFQQCVSQFFLNNSITIVCLLCVQNWIHDSKFKADAITKTTKFLSQGVVVPQECYSSLLTTLLMFITNTFDRVILTWNEFIWCYACVFFNTLNVYSQIWCYLLWWNIVVQIYHKFIVLVFLNYAGHRVILQ